MEQDRGAVVVTGVSSGIGAATAEVLLARGYTVFGSVRSSAHADRLVEAGNGRFVPLSFDVTDERAIADAARCVSERIGERTLTGLVNSAGIAVAGPLLHQTSQEFRRHFDVNVTGPFQVTRAFASLLGAEPGRSGKPGRIVIVSSISGGLATPFLGAYAASKHALEGYADALRRELMIFGIDVVIVGPGAVSTPIWDKAESQGNQAYAETPFGAAFAGLQRYMIDNGRKGLPAETIGALIADAIAADRPRARYTIMRNRFAGWTIPRLLPRRMLDRMLAKRMGLARR